MPGTQEAVNKCLLNKYIALVSGSTVLSRHSFKAPPKALSHSLKSHCTQRATLSPFALLHGAARKFPALSEAYSGCWMKQREKQGENGGRPADDCSRPDKR